LAALRVFFTSLAAREPSAIAQCTTKRRRPALRHLDANEVEAILAQLVVGH
jgi:hypothetical protein